MAEDSEKMGTEIHWKIICCYPHHMHNALPNLEKEGPEKIQSFVSFLFRLTNKELYEISLCLTYLTQ